MQVLRQSTAVDVLIGPFVDDTDGYTAEEGRSPSVLLSKNGQALAAKNDATTPVHDDAGYYNCELDDTDTNTVGTLVLIVEADGEALPVRHEFQIVEEAVYDALFAASAPGYGTAQTGDSYAIVNNADYGNAKLVRSTTPANTLTVDANHLVAVPDTQKVDVNTIKTATVAASSTVTFANGTVSTYAGGDTSGVTELLTRIPDATAGQNGGLTICGNNAATTFASLTCSGALTISDGVIIAAATTNRNGISATGNGTGCGILATSGTGLAAVGIKAKGNSATAIGVSAEGGVTGFNASGTALGVGVSASSSGAGVSIVGAGTGHGLSITGGSGATGNGVSIVTASTNGTGLLIAGTGTGHGVDITAGGGTNSYGIYVEALGTYCAGIYVNANEGMSHGVMILGGYMGLECQAANDGGCGAMFFADGANGVGLACVVTNSGPAVNLNEGGVIGGGAIHGTIDASVAGAATMDVTGTVSGNSTHSAADVVTALGTGTTLTDIPWNAAWDSEVQSECTDALTAAALTSAGIADAVLDESMSGHTTAGTLGKAVADILEDTGTTLPAAIALVGGAAGAGANSVTITWNDNEGNPIPNGQVWISSDAAGSNIVAGTLITDSNGQATFQLDSGSTYYLWAQADGYNSLQGTQFTAVAD